MTPRLGAHRMAALHWEEARWLRFALARPRVVRTGRRASRAGPSRRPRGRVTAAPSPGRRGARGAASSRWRRLTEIAAGSAHRSRSPGSDRGSRSGSAQTLKGIALAYGSAPYCRPRAEDPDTVEIAKADTGNGHARRDQPGTGRSSTCAGDCDNGNDWRRHAAPCLRACRRGSGRARAPASICTGPGTSPRRNTSAETAEAVQLVRDEPQRAPRQAPRRAICSRGTRGASRRKVFLRRAPRGCSGAAARRICRTTARATARRRSGTRWRRNRPTLPPKAFTGWSACATSAATGGPIDRKTGGELEAGRGNTMLQDVEAREIEADPTGAVQRALAGRTRDPLTKESYMKRFGRVWALSRRRCVRRRACVRRGRGRGSRRKRPRAGVSVKDGEAGPDGSGNAARVPASATSATRHSR